MFGIGALLGLAGALLHPTWQRLLVGLTTFAIGSIPYVLILRWLLTRWPWEAW